MHFNLLKKLFLKLTKKNKNVPVQYTEMIRHVLNGIPDVIGVYTTEHEILFYNKAGYEYYKTSPDQIKGKKCYQMLFQEQKCQDCPVDRAINSKGIVRKEKYVSSLDSYMDYCCTPVLDETGKVLFVVELLRDISSKKKMDEVLKESGKNYRKIVNLSPDSILVSVNGTIELANHQAMELFNEPIGAKLEEYILPEYRMKVIKGNYYVLDNNTEKVLVDCKVISKNNSTVDVQISISFFSYKGRAAILYLVRDVSEKNKELNEVKKYQIMRLQKPFPLQDKCILETTYIPAKGISGDFYYFHKVNENLAVGILGDICGKSFKAALSISAFNVLFHEAVLITSDPENILNIINKKIAYYFDENYIAAVCFSFDFSRNEAVVAGAGINEFVVQQNEGEAYLKNVEGAYLGMFSNSEFEKISISFMPGDRISFFSDGLSSIINESTVSRCFSKNTLIQQKDNIEKNIVEMMAEVKSYKDDCTLLLFERRC